MSSRFRGDIRAANIYNLVKDGNMKPRKAARYCDRMNAMMAGEDHAWLYMGVGGRRPRYVGMDIVRRSSGVSVWFAHIMDRQRRGVRSRMNRARRWRP